MKIEILHHDPMRGEDFDKLVETFDKTIEFVDFWNWKAALDERGRLILAKDGSSDVIIIED